MCSSSGRSYYGRALPSCREYLQAGDGSPDCQLGNLCKSGLAGFTCAAWLTRSSARSGESSADKPPPLAVTSACRLQDAHESVCLEQANRPHIRGSLVNAIAFGVYRVTLNHDRAAGARMLNCAIK